MWTLSRKHRPHSAGYGGAVAMTVYICRWTICGKHIYRTQCQTWANYFFDILWVCIWTKADKFQLNKIKCKELRIDFSKSDKGFNPVNVNDRNLEVVNHAKLLGLNLSKDLKWNIHISEIIKKAASRLYFLRQLKWSKVASKELTQFCVACIRPVTKYACQVYHNSLPNYLSNDLEWLQKCAMHVIHPEHSYAEALNEAGLQPLSERRQSITSQFFKQIAKDKNHRLHPLLSEEKALNNLRKSFKFVLPKCKTKHCQSSFINLNFRFYNS